MKIVKVKGGLGNQMFQYTFAKLLQKRTGDEIRLDYSYFTEFKSSRILVPRSQNYCLSIPMASKKEIEKICLLRHNGNPKSFRYKSGIFLEGIINGKYFIEPNRAYIAPEKIIHNNFFDGYWQSWRYYDEVKEEVKKDFIPKTELSWNTVKMQEKIRNQNSVFVGVRKGEDYSKGIEHFGTFNSEYYQRAMDYIADRVRNPVFYIFSNDIEWCKRNLNWGKHKVIYREPEQQTNDFEELILMTSCKHAVIINSSYHWWGATLISNKEKIVCCPMRWWFDNKPIDIIPDTWKRISN